MKPTSLRPSSPVSRSPSASLLSLTIADTLQTSPSTSNTMSDARASAAAPTSLRSSISILRSPTSTRSSGSAQNSAIVSREAGSLRRSEGTEPSLRSASNVMLSRESSA